MLTMNMKRLQMNLNYLGFYSGAIDGIKGNQTKEAIRNYRVSRGLSNNDIADQAMIDVLRTEIIAEQRKYGATEDGVAGNQTIQKKNEYMSKHSVNEWDNIQHFKKSEFACKCGCGFDSINIELVKILEQIRSHFGNNPVHITSGCRCKNHNARVGGVQGSRHVQAKASDIYVDNVSTKDLLNYTKSLVNNGQLRYTYTNSANMNGVVHIDIK